ncbi:TPA: hypothetical protein N2N45_003946 [Klebsiella aerogenes]|nr:hypothetical protein [Klebsiella aerogenes]
MDNEQRCLLNILYFFRKSGKCSVMNIFTAVCFLIRQYYKACILTGMTVLLSACGQSGAKVIPGHNTENNNYPLPYKVTLSSTKGDRIQCDNCGNSGRTVLISGGENLSQYHMMVDSPYYAFLCTRQEKECRSGKWVAINKNLTQPVVNHINIGGQDDIRDLRPSNTQERTWLQVFYKNGRVTRFEFDNKR